MKDEIRDILEEIVSIYQNRLERAEPLKNTEAMSVDDFQSIRLNLLSAKLELARHIKGK